MTSGERQWFDFALAETTVPQIATFTGHSLRDVEAILDAITLDATFRLLKPQC